MDPVFGRSCLHLLSSVSIVFIEQMGVATNVEQLVHRVIGIPGIQRFGEIPVICSDWK